MEELMKSQQPSNSDEIIDQWKAMFLGSII